MTEHRRILVTGGAGFVGSNTALSLKAARPGSEVIAFDNLKRRGSELTLSRLRQAGVQFEHGDVRSAEDVDAMGAFDLMVDCSAEPSVHAGYGADPRYLINTNLGGTINCLEAARRHGADVIFLSSSRIYPIKALRALPLEVEGARLNVPAGASGEGWSREGIAADFPLTGARSLYGATKLASELLVEEYVDMYGLRAVVNRCGVLTGPWQMGKVDQGFVVLWASRHLYGGKLAYMGFGGHGHQVRDILHVADLNDLLEIQLSRLDEISGSVFNVGGGLGCSVSLAELTTACAARAGNSIEITADPDTRAADIPYYVTDNAVATERLGWRPKRSVDDILDDVFQWLTDHRAQLEPLLGPA